MEQKKLAAIDIGTNSVRLLLGNLRGADFIMEEKLLATTRLGEGTVEQDLLLTEPMGRTVLAIREFADIAAGRGYDLLGAYATSAVREAPNRDAFLALCNAAGVSVEVLSGHGESTVAYYGVTGGGKGLCAVADIGGGSTELSYGEDGALRYGQSARVGAVRMREMFAEKDGSLPEEQKKALHAYVTEQLVPIAGRIPKEAILWGVGGTFTTLAAVKLNMREYSREKVQGTELTLSDLWMLSDRLCAMSLEERLAYPGIPARRADIIPAASVIARAVLEATGIGAVLVSDRDGLDGYAEAKAKGLLEQLLRE